MKNLLCRFGASLAATVLLFLASGRLCAQEAPGLSSANPRVSEEAHQAELVKSYLQLREHLQTAQRALAASRVEEESVERNQSTILATRLEAIKTALDAERERTRLEADRNLNQRAELERGYLARSNSRMLWVAIVVGGLAIIAMIAGLFLQWRAINRLAAILAGRPPQLETSSSATASSESRINSDQPAVTNQRIQGVVERLERRVLELEGPTGHRVPTGPVATTSTYISGQTMPRSIEPVDLAARIRLLLANGHSLLAVGKAQEAAACYNEVLRLDLNHAEALVKRGAALERLKQDDEAIQCYDRAIRADAKMTLAYLYKGGVCNRLERYEEASRCYEQALRNEDASRAAAHVSV